MQGEFVQNKYKYLKNLSNSKNNMSLKSSNQNQNFSPNSRRDFLTRLGAGTVALGSISSNSFSGAEISPLNEMKDKNFQWDPYKFGAKGDGKTLDTKAIQMTIDRCSAEGGGIICFYGGTFISGTIFLKSNITLYIEAGATIRASANLDDFPSIPSNYPSINGEYVTHKMLIYAEDAKNISIYGQGTIDGRGDEWVEGPYGSPSFSLRPRILYFRACEGVIIRDVTLYNSASWVQLYQSCKNIVIDGITVNSRENKDVEKPVNADAPGRNNDGLGLMDSQFARISNCFINSGDDAIVLKSTANEERCANITITNCVISSNRSAIKIGTETSGAFEDITVTNCVIYDTRSNGIALTTVDGARMERINVSNINIQNLKGAAIFIRLGNRGKTYRKNTIAKKGIIKDIIIQNIQGTRVSSGWIDPDYNSSITGCSISGIPGQHVENIILKNINLEIDGGGQLENVDRIIPENEKGSPSGTMFGVLPSYGFFIRHAKNIILEEIHLRFMREDFRPAIVCEDVEALEIRNLQAQCTFVTPALISFKDIRGAIISNCRPMNPLPVFLKLKGDNSSDINLIFNQLKNVKKAFLIEDDSQSEVIEVFGNLK